MTEQPAEEPRKKPDLWAGLFGGPIPTNVPKQNPFDPGPKPGLAGTGLTDEMLAALGVPPRPSERPPVELSAERRAHVARFSAEFKEWVAGGFTRQEALAVVAMEIQLEARFKHQRDEG